jgi:DMSO/TMAO reductase YedYZ molybdopterin-dependent catalytic subunit
MIDQDKTQGDAIPVAEGLPSDVIVSPDTLREKRVPPGQSRTKKWPILDAAGPPRIDLTKWRLSVNGLVVDPMEWTWQEFIALPRVKVFADFHCVTRWSRLGICGRGFPRSTFSPARAV